MSAEKATYEAPGQAPPPTYTTPQHTSPDAVYQQPQHPQQAFAQTGDKNGSYYGGQQQQQQGQQNFQQAPQQNFQQQQAQQTQYRNAVPLMSLGSNPAPVDCPNCHQRAMTATEFISGNTTNAWALVLFLTVCCCCIPYLIDGTKDVTHKCSNCGARLATWHRSGRVEMLPGAHA